MVGRVRNPNSPQLTNEKGCIGVGSAVFGSQLGTGCPYFEAEQPQGSAQESCRLREPYCGGFEPVRIWGTTHEGKPSCVNKRFTDVTGSFWDVFGLHGVLRLRLDRFPLFSSGAIGVRKSFQAARTGLSGRTRLAPSHALCAAQFSA